MQSEGGSQYSWSTVVGVVVVGVVVVVVVFSSFIISHFTDLFFRCVVSMIFADAIS